MFFGHDSPHEIRRWGDSIPESTKLSTQIYEMECFAPDSYGACRQLQKRELPTVRITVWSERRWSGRIENYRAVVLPGSISILHGVGANGIRPGIWHSLFTNRRFGLLFTKVKCSRLTWPWVV